MKGKIVAFIIVDSILTMLLVGWFVFERIAEIPRSMTQIVVPGSKELTLEAGEHVVCWEHYSTVDGKSYAQSPIPVPKFECALRAKEGGKSIEFSSTWTKGDYTWFDRRGIVLMSCTIEKPGVYQFTATTDKETVLAVGPAFGGKLLVAILGGLGLAFGLIGASVVVVLLAKRMGQR